MGALSRWPQKNLVRLPRVAHGCAFAPHPALLFHGGFYQECECRSTRIAPRVVAYTAHRRVELAHRFRYSGHLYRHCTDPLRCFVTLRQHHCSLALCTRVARFTTVVGDPTREFDPPRNSLRTPAPDICARAICAFDWNFRRCIVALHESARSIDVLWCSASDTTRHRFCVYCRPAWCSPVGAVCLAQSRASVRQRTCSGVCVCLDRVHVLVAPVEHRNSASLDCVVVCSTPPCRDSVMAPHHRHRNTSCGLCTAIEHTGGFGGDLPTRCNAAGVATIRMARLSSDGEYRHHRTACSRCRAARH